MKLFFLDIKYKVTYINWVFPSKIKGRGKRSLYANIWTNIDEKIDGVIDY